MLKHMQSIIDETQKVFDKYVEKYGLFSRMTRSVYMSLVEQHRIYDLLKEKIEEDENERIKTSEER